MNRKPRRAARKSATPYLIHTQTIAIPATGDLYWFECPENFSIEEGIPADATLHGPFKTDAEVAESQRLVLLGPQCKVTEAGMWDPAWGRPQ